MLTLVECTLLLYRAFLPAHVWYRFFLKKEYGSLFSSFTTCLYLTLKLTSIVEKVYFLFLLCYYRRYKKLSNEGVHVFCTTRLLYYVMSSLVLSIDFLQRYTHTCNIIISLYITSNFNIEFTVFENRIIVTD